MNIYNHNDLFLNNKYTRWYYNIIIKAQNSNRVKLKRTDPNYIYYENHHVLPNCMFPQYSKLKDHTWNGVLLTAKEHYICHALLVKMITTKKHKYQMLNAFSQMYNQKTKHQQRYTSKLYEYFKYKMKLPDETKLRMSISRIGKKHSQETKDKIGAKHKNKLVSKETRKKISHNSGIKTLSNESRMKIRLSNTGKKRSEKAIENYKNSWTPDRRRQRSFETKRWREKTIINFIAEHNETGIFIIENINNWCKENGVNISTLKDTLKSNIYSRKYGYRLIEQVIYKYK